MAITTSAVTVTEVAARLVTPGFYTTVEGPATFARVHRAGWYGVGYDNHGPPALDIITYGRFLSYVYEDVHLAPPTVFGDTFFWDMIAGASIEIEVDW